MSLGPSFELQERVGPPALECRNSEPAARLRPRHGVRREREGGLIVALKQMAFRDPALGLTRLALRPDVAISGQCCVEKLESLFVSARPRPDLSQEPRRHRSAGTPPRGAPHAKRGLQ